MSDDDPPTWTAPDGTHWFWTGGTINGWTGWQPGEDGHWFYSKEDFRRVYPDAPRWDTSDE